MSDVIRNYGSGLFAAVAVLAMLAIFTALSVINSSGATVSNPINVTGTAEEENLGNGAALSSTAVSTAQNYANRTAPQVDTVVAKKNVSYKVTDIIKSSASGGEISVVSVTKDAYTARDRNNISAGRIRTHEDYTDSVLSVNALGEQYFKFGQTGRYYVRYRIIQNGGAADGAVRSGNIWLFVREK